MKLRFFTRSKIFFGVLLACIFAVACEYDVSEDLEIFLFEVTATATGAEEVPQVSTPARGTVTGTLNKNTRELSYTLTWENLKDSALFAHFHGPASPGENKPVLVTIFGDRRGRSGTISNTVTLADTTAQFFMNGRIYVNVHSKVHPGGEIRGQVTVR
jgi:hypothetical protein